MKKILFLLIPALFLLSCTDDDEGVKLTTATITSPAISGNGFEWSKGDRIGVYLTAPAMNQMFEATDVDASGRATFTGQLGGSGTLYAYYPYNESLNSNPTMVHFDLQEQQSSTDNIFANTFLIATPLADAGGKNNLEVTFNEVAARLDFTITVPSDFGGAYSINSVSVTCYDKPFYIQALADLTTNKLSFAPRSLISGRSRITVNNSDNTPTAAGSSFSVSMALLPDDYTDTPVTVTVTTDKGSYDFTYTMPEELTRGANHAIEYTLKSEHWYDPGLPRIEVEALPATNPVSTPVRVRFPEVIAQDIVPVSIIFTPDDPNGKVVYNLTARDITLQEATVAKGNDNKRLAPSTDYFVEMLDGSQNVVASATITTEEGMDISDMEIVEPGTDIGALLADPSRKETIFLNPGIHYNNSDNADVVITKNLKLMGDDPENTRIISSRNLAPKGNISTLNFSGFTWEGTRGHFLRPWANDTNGGFSFDNIIIDNVVFDYSAPVSGGYGNIYFPRARASENSVERKGRVGNYTLNNVIYIGNGGAVTPDDNFQVVFHTGGTDFWVQVESITITNSTFTGLYFGLIVLPSPSALPDQKTNNGGVEPVIKLENNTFYHIATKSGFTNPSGVIHTGSGSYSLMPTLSLKNNIIIFGGNPVARNLIHCTADTQGNSQNIFDNNWGLKSEPWYFRGAAWDNYDVFDGSETDLFESPGYNVTTSGISLKVKANVNAAGDPRWY